MNKSNLPRRKQLKRKNRLASATKWIPSYSGKNIVKGYANWFGVDLLCSIKELRMNGVIIAEEYENQVLKSMLTKINDKQIDDKSTSDINLCDRSDYSNQNFAFIAGYTSGGAPFGMNHKQIMNHENENLVDKHLKHR